MDSVPTVVKVRARPKCVHGKQKSYCKECGGSSLCEHEKRRSECKECGGSAFCEHGRRKARCKECGGSAYCEHGKVKAKCRECGGSSFREHESDNLSMASDGCTDNSSSSIKRKRDDAEGGIEKVVPKRAKCEHGRRKADCRECGGSSFCMHGRRKKRCKDCPGNYVVRIRDDAEGDIKKEVRKRVKCEHGRRKADCRECGGSSFCVHGKRKNRCKECVSGSDVAP